MFQTRSLTTGFLVASLGLAAGFAIVGSPNLASAEPGCDKLKITAVQDVCKKGGVKAVKDAMKKSADAATLKCAACHADQKDYALKSNAVEDFNAKMAGTFGK